MDSDTPLVTGTGQTPAIGQRLHTPSSAIEHALIIIGGTDQVGRSVFVQQAYVCAGFCPKFRPLGQVTNRLASFARNDRPCPLRLTINLMLVYKIKHQLDGIAQGFDECVKLAAGIQSFQSRKIGFPLTMDLATVSA